MTDAQQRGDACARRPYLTVLALGLGLPVATFAAAAAWRGAESRLGLRGALAVKSPACQAGFRNSLPSDGWRLADGTFVLARRAVPGPGGTFLFNDNAGRARCFRPIP